MVAVTIVLFVPDSFKPEVSYLSHFLGYFAGAFSGIVYYYLFKKKIKSAEVIEVVHEDDYVWGSDLEFVNEDYHEDYIIDRQISNSPCHQKG